MVKNYLLLLLSTVLLMFTKAQTANVLIEGLQLPSSMHIYNHTDGNRLYFAEWMSGKIAYVNIDNNIPEVTEVVSADAFSADRVYGMAVYNDELYFCDSGSDVRTIKKISLLEENPTVTSVLYNFSLPFDLLFVGDILYILDNEAGTISKTDMTSSPLAVEVLVSDLNDPFAMTYNEENQTIYFTQRGSGYVSSIDTSTPNPTVINIVEGLDYPSGIGIKNNVLYVVEAYQGNEISKIDLTLSEPIAEHFVEAGNASTYVDPSGLEISGNTLYYTTFDYSNGTIYTIDISDDSLLIKDINTNKKSSKVVEGKLFVSESDTYKIDVYNFNGQQIKSESNIAISKNEGYNLNLPKGRYIITVQNNKNTESIKTIIK